MIFGTQAGAAESLAPASSDLQGSLPIADIDRGVIRTRDGKWVALFEVLPMNFFLQNTAERERIVSCFAAWLRIAPRNLQILCLSQPVDVEQYTRRMQECMDAEPDPRCRECIADNIRQVRSMVQNGAFTTRFFVAYQYEADMGASPHTELYRIASTAKGYLARCGLTVVEPQYIDNQMVETVFGMLCKQTSRNIRLPVDFRFMMRDCMALAAAEAEAAAIEQAAAEQASKGGPAADEETSAQPRRGRKKSSSKHKKNEPTGVMELICPASADFTARDYIELDGVYHAYLYIAGYGYRSTVRGGWLALLVGLGDGISLSITLHRRPREKILPKVANSTMWSRSRMRDVDDTRADYEQMDSAIYAGQYIKSQMNRANEDYYDMYTLIEVTADAPELLKARLSEVERFCSSQDIICKRCDYEEEQAFHSFLPVVSVAPEIARKARRNVLLSGVAGSFPFYSMELCEQSGILIGCDRRSRSVCMLDIFDSNRYSNANAVELGMSGAGKTVLLQLIAMRYRQQGKQVFLIAPYKGHEYRAACEAIGGLYIKLAPSSTDCINFMEIRRSSLDVNAELDRTETRADSLLSDKISRLHIYFSLLRRSLTEEDMSKLDVELSRLYRRFGITRDNDSLLDREGRLRPQPTPKDFYDLLMEQEDTKHVPAQPFRNRLMRHRRQILLDQRPAVPAEYLCKIQRIQEGQDQVAAAEAFGKTLLCDRCPIHREERLTTLPSAADLVGLPVLRTDGKLHAQKRRTLVLQPVRIPATEERCAGERISDRIRDRTFALIIMSRDRCHAAECPAALVCKAAEAGNSQPIYLYGGALCHQHAPLCIWLSIRQCRTEAALS